MINERIYIVPPFVQQLDSPASAPGLEPASFKKLISIQMTA